MTEVQVFFTANEAANYLRFSPTTLAIWRSQGRGPNYAKIGGSVRYRRSDMELWVNADEAGRRELERSSECHSTKRGLVKRPRGRAGAELRANRLINEPLCRDCVEDGIERPSEEVDHIIPLSKGGSDDDANIRCLCRGCHARRTRSALSAVAEEE